MGKIKDFFFGGTAKAITETASGIADIVERWKPGEGSKHEMEMEIQEYLQKSYASARAHDVTLNSGVPIVDAFINGINRLIRPWVTITVVGSLFGYWELPPPEAIGEDYWTMAQIVLSFWFGGRFLVKDVPRAIRALAT